LEIPEGGKFGMFGNKKRVSIFSVILVVSVLLTVGAVGGHVAGASSPPGLRTTFTYLIATDPLCGLDPSACPAVSKAANGDIIEVTGAGAFTLGPKAVTGGGTFVHKNAAGDVLASGEWRAVQLLSFQSYGSGSAQGLPPEFWGGKLMLRVLIIPDGAGITLGGIMRVTCELGNKIPGGAAEGIRLVVQDVINFNKEVSGLTLYIRG